MNNEKKIEDPLISVIVPIYNVEKYVRKCLESLRGQTLREIEIICIDDGSTDGSGRIADEYESQDWPRFRVIHTENRGLSAARNRGIDEARSQWLMFVDSDDWVDRDFCRVPYEAAMENQADLVIFEAYRTTDSGRIRKARKPWIQSGVVDAENVINDSVAWNKLYKKELFNDIHYPEGYMYEDIATTHKLIHKATRILKIPCDLYYYRYRKGSIGNSTIGVDDLFLMSKQRYDELLKLGYPRQKVEAPLIASALRYCGKAQDEDNCFFQEAVSIVKERPSIRLRGKAKIKKGLFFLNKNLYRLIYKLAMRVKT